MSGKRNKRYERTISNGKPTGLPSRSSEKVRPVTSHGRTFVDGSISSSEKQQLTNGRPRTAAAAGLRRVQPSTNYTILGSRETTSETRKIRTSSPEFLSSNGRAQRNRSLSLCSVSSSSSRQKSRRPTISAASLDLKQNRPASRSFTKLNSSSFNGELHHRKVAWQTNADKPSVPTVRVSHCDGIVGDGRKGDKVERESGIEQDNNESDMFEPPDLDMMDSGEEYETELEDNTPEEKEVKQYDPSGRNTYQRLCKKEDVLAASGLSNQFMKNEINIRHRGLGWKGALPLAKSLTKNTYVEKLDIADNYIEGIGAQMVAEMLLDNCYITELDLSQNFIRAEGGIALAKMLTRNQVLRKVILKANHFTDRVAKEFAETLRENRTLSHLDISHNDIGEKGAVYLGAGLALNYGLKHLNLSWNCIRGKGGVALAQALKTNDCLTSLLLSWNGISLLGCVALGKFLRRNENLKELDLSNNRIGHLGAQRITPAILKNSSLESLKIGLNPLSDNGVEALLKAIKINKTLKFLSLEDVTVSENVYRDIQQLERDRDIKIITGGLGGYKKPKQMPRQMVILLDFIKVNRLRLVDWFFRFDKDKSGDITRDEFKNGLKETGLKLTPKQLDSLMEYLDVDNDGKIDFSELLIGREHTLREQRDFRMAQQRIKGVEDLRAKLPTLSAFKPD